MTNGDKIRRMTDEELAAQMTEKFYVCSVCPAFEIGKYCGECQIPITKWLKQEVDENG